MATLYWEQQKANGRPWLTFGEAAHELAALKQGVAKRIAARAFEKSSAALTKLGITAEDLALYFYDSAKRDLWTEYCAPPILRTFAESVDLPFLWDSEHRGGDRVAEVVAHGIYHKNRSYFDSQGITPETIFRAVRDQWRDEKLAGMGPILKRLGLRVPDPDTNKGEARMLENNGVAILRPDLEKASLSDLARALESLSHSLTWSESDQDSLRRQIRREIIRRIGVTDKEWAKYGHGAMNP